MSFQLSAVDNEELIHDAVRQGHIFSLEVYLNQNSECLNKLFTYHESKWTPLLAACFYKHEHIVRMLLTRFKPDIEAVGIVTCHSIDSSAKLAEDVSPLWTAAAVNRFDIVKLLIEHGNANTNHLMKTHSTPLRAACFHNNLAMVQYLIEHSANPNQAKLGNYTNLMLSAGRQYPLIVKYLVDEIQCDINERDENGQTALYYSVRSDSIDITKFLLEHGALNFRDTKRRITPLMRAALYGNIELVDLFKDYCSDLEWIEAKELLAVSFSGFLSGIDNSTKTIEYLTEAFELRQTKNLPKQLTLAPLKISDHRRECETLEQFNELLRSNSKDVLFIELILICQRLLGEEQCDYHDIIHYYGAILADSKQYYNCFRYWFYELDLKQKYNINYSIEYLNCIVHLFVQMRFDEHIDILIDDLLRMFDILNDMLNSDHYIESFESCLITLLHLITIVAQIIYSEASIDKQKLSIDHCRDLYKVIKNSMQHQRKSLVSGSSLLHLCTTYSPKYISYRFPYPCWMTTRLLINCGADIDAMDFDGNTPLHILIQNSLSPNVLKMIDLFSDAGVHLDYVNNQRLSPMQLASTFHRKLTDKLKKQLNVIKLKCLCARLIRQQQFSYQNILSTSLVEFVQKH